MIWLLFLIPAVAADFKQPHYTCERTTMVQLFEWKWDDIADECEMFLGPKGYGGVQIPPPSENLVLWEYNRTWWERYQPMSYRLITRSGDEEQFANMVRRCNDVGVRIYADTILNHMTNTYDENVGTGGSTADFATWSYPAVPYGYEDFHYPDCVIQPDDNICCADRVRNCRLYGLKDLNQTKEYVRQKLVGYMNKLIDHGVAGFRLGDSRNMFPSDLKVIYSRLQELNVNHGFPTGARPYIYQEVLDVGGEAISNYEYTDLAAVREFRFGVELSHVFKGTYPLKNLVNWGPEWGLLDSKTASTLIDNHDLQRGNLGPRFYVLTHKSPKPYKAVVAFMLAHPYGKPVLMSSFAFTDPDAPPPMDKYGNLISRSINADGSCGNGWVCEHRWRQIFQMVEFRNVARETLVENWWDNGSNQIAFSRGDRAFIVFNLEGCDLNLTLQTGLPPGTYCDVISGVRRGASCTGTKVIVRKDGTANIRISSSAEDYHLAIHVGPQSSLKDIYEN